MRSTRPFIASPIAFVSLIFAGQTPAQRSFRFISAFIDRHVWAERPVRLQFPDAVVY